VAFAGEAHTSQTAGSESGVRRSRKAVGKPAAKVTKSRAEAESDQNLHSRSAMSQAIIASSEAHKAQLCDSLIFSISDDTLAVSSCCTCCSLLQLGDGLAYSMQQRNANDALSVMQLCVKYSDRAGHRLCSTEQRLRDSTQMWAASAHGCAPCL